MTIIFEKNNGLMGNEEEFLIIEKSGMDYTLKTSVFAMNGGFKTKVGFYGFEFEISTKEEKEDNLFITESKKRLIDYCSSIEGGNEEVIHLVENELRKLKQVTSHPIEVFYEQVEEQVAKQKETVKKEIMKEIDEEIDKEFFDLLEQKNIITRTEIELTLIDLLDEQKEFNFDYEDEKVVILNPEIAFNFSSNFRSIEKETLNTIIEEIKNDEFTVRDNFNSDSDDCKFSFSSSNFRTIVIETSEENAEITMTANLIFEKETM